LVLTKDKNRSAPFGAHEECTTILSAPTVVLQHTRVTVLVSAGGETVCRGPFWGYRSSFVREEREVYGQILIFDCGFCFLLVSVDVILIGGWFFVVVDGTATTVALTGTPSRLFIVFCGAVRKNVNVIAVMKAKIDK